jgi:hypothetical protein
MLKKKKEGKLVTNTQWGTSKGGRPPLIDERDVKDIANELQESGCRAFGKADINKLIVERQKAILEDSGHVAINVPEQLNKTTLNNYYAELAFESDIALVNKSIPKTNTRYASEGSIIGSVNNVILEAVTGFVEVHEEDLSIRNQMKKLPKETSLLYNLVQMLETEVL